MYVYVCMNERIYVNIVIYMCVYQNFEAHTVHHRTYSSSDFVRNMTADYYESQ